MKDFKFYLDQWGVQDVIYQKNTELTTIERQVMERALSEVQNSFVQDFGTEGTFELKFIRQKIGGKGARYVNGTRPVYRISAGDKKTGAILKAHPLWLDRFNKKAKL